MVHYDHVQILLGTPASYDGAWFVVTSLTRSYFVWMDYLDSHGGTPPSDYNKVGGIPLYVALDNSHNTAEKITNRIRGQAFSSPSVAFEDVLCTITGAGQDTLRMTYKLPFVGTSINCLMPGINIGSFGTLFTSTIDQIGTYTDTFMLFPALTTHESGTMFEYGPKRIATGLSFTADAEAKDHGNYGGLLTFDGGTGEENTAAMICDGSVEHYVRFRVNFKSVDQTGGYTVLLREGFAPSLDDLTQWKLEFDNFTAVLSTGDMRVSHENGSFTSSVESITKDAWHEIEIRYYRHATAGIFEGWLDGRPWFSWTGVNTEYRVRAGQGIRLGVGDGGAVNLSSGDKIYVDDFAIDTQPIGMRSRIIEAEFIYTPISGYQGQYIKWDSPSKTFAFWFSFDGAGSAPPDTNSYGWTAVEVTLVTGDTLLTSATKLSTAVDAQSELIGEVSGAVVTIKNAEPGGVEITTLSATYWTSTTVQEGSCGQEELTLPTEARHENGDLSEWNKFHIDPDGASITAITAAALSGTYGMRCAGGDNLTNISCYAAKTFYATHFHCKFKLRWVQGVLSFDDVPVVIPLSVGFPFGVSHLRFQTSAAGVGAISATSNYLSGSSPTVTIAKDEIVDIEFNFKYGTEAHFVGTIKGQSFAFYGDNTAGVSPEHMVVGLASSWFTAAAEGIFDYDEFEFSEGWNYQVHDLTITSGNPSDFAGNSFRLYTRSSAYSAWFNLDGGNTPPSTIAALGHTPVEVTLVSGDNTAELIAEKLKVALDALSDYAATRSGAVVTATVQEFGRTISPYLDNPLQNYMTFSVTIVGRKIELNPSWEITHDGGDLSEHGIVIQDGDGDIEVSADPTAAMVGSHGLLCTRIGGVYGDGRGFVRDFVEFPKDKDIYARFYFRVPTSFVQTFSTNILAFYLGMSDAGFDNRQVYLFMNGVTNKFTWYHNPYGVIGPDFFTTDLIRDHDYLMEIRYKYSKGGSLDIWIDEILHGSLTDKDFTQWGYKDTPIGLTVGNVGTPWQDSGGLHHDQIQVSDAYIGPAPPAPEVDEIDVDISDYNPQVDTEVTVTLTAKSEGVPWPDWETDQVLIIDTNNTALFPDNLHWVDGTLDVISEAGASTSVAVGAVFDSNGQATFKVRYRATDDAVQIQVTHGSVVGISTEITWSDQGAGRLVPWPAKANQRGTADIALARKIADPILAGANEIKPPETGSARQITGPSIKKADHPY